MSIQLQHHSSDSLAQEYAVKRMIKAGFSKYACIQALNVYQNEWLALLSLTNELIGYAPQGPGTQELNDELEALASIFGDLFQVKEETTVTCCFFTIEPCPIPLSLELHIPKSTIYPFELPVIIVQGKN